jgi:hypothetical protein
VSRPAPRRGPAARARGGAACAVLLALGLAACGPGASDDPVGERLRRVTTDPAAARAVAAMLSAYGGWETWSARSTVDYRYTIRFYGGETTPQQVTRQAHHLSLRGGVQVSIEDLDGPDPRRVSIDGDAIRVTRGGRPVGDAAEIDFRRVFAHVVRWDFLTPWNVLDPGSRLTSRGVRTPTPAGPVPAGPCDVVRLRFDQEGEGGGTDDWYDLYISQRSHLIEQIHSYRAAPNDFRLAVWSGHLDFDGIRVATRRETYASDATAAPGRLEAVAELSDVRFDAGDSAPADASTTPGARDQDAASR